jgi:hypothetical protein
MFDCQNSDQDLLDFEGDGGGRESSCSSWTLEQTTAFNKSWANLIIGIRRRFDMWLMNSAT